MSTAAIEVVPVIAIGTGVGAAVGDVVLPKLQNFLNDQWANHPDKPLNAAAVAELVAETVWSVAQGEAEAAHTGFGTDKLAALVELAKRAPDFGTLMQLYRRELIGDDGINFGLDKARIPERWHSQLRALRDVRLDPAVVATAVQRGVLPNEGLLPVGPPSAVGVVPPMPVVAIDPIDEAKDSGWNFDRLAVQARITGLPPGPGELLNLLNRGAIQHADYLRGISEGNIRNEWGPALEQLRYDLISPAIAAELRLRGWKTEDEAADLGALTGARRDVMEMLYLARGRPMAPVQAFTAFFRGAPGPDGGAFGKDDFLRAIRQSDIRPEYGEPLWGIRHAYPSLFQLRRAVQDGSILPDRGRTILRYERYEDQDADGLLASWTKAGVEAAKGLTKTELAAEYEGLFITEAEFRTSLAALGYTGPAQDMEINLADARRVKKYRDKGIDRVNKFYVKHAIDEATARVDLELFGVTGQAADLLLSVWAHERQIEQLQLTPAQIKRAYYRALLTLADATARLEERGYSAADAAIFLAE